MKKFIIKYPIKLLDALKQMYPDSSNNTLRDILKNKRIQVDGKTKMQANLLLEVGQTLHIAFASKSMSCGIRIIYEDPFLIVINKPESLLSVPLDNNKEAIHAYGILRQHYPSVYIVHRLDRDTSGIMLFAKDSSSQQALKELFKKHDIQRVYLAIVEGYVSNSKGRWKSTLIEHGTYAVKTSQNPHKGELAITDYVVIKRSKNYSYLRLSLKTGKKHQIRVQCKEAGHPIVGDKKYNAQNSSAVKRLCLHSYFMEFIHPISKKKLKFSAPLPLQMQQLGFICS